MTVSDLIGSFVSYIKQTWENSPSTASPLSADRLNFMETGIQNNSDAIESMASKTATEITQLNSDLSKQQDYYDTGVITSCRLTTSDSLVDYILGFTDYQIVAFTLPSGHSDAPYSSGSSLILGVKLSSVAGLLIAANHSNGAICYGRIASSALTWYSANVS